MDVNLTTERQEEITWDFKLSENGDVWYIVSYRSAPPEKDEGVLVFRSDAEMDAFIDGCRAIRGEVDQRRREIASEDA